MHNFHHQRNQGGRGRLPPVHGRPQGERARRARGACGRAGAGAVPGHRRRRHRLRHAGRRGPLRYGALFIVRLLFIVFLFYLLID